MARMSTMGVMKDGETVVGYAYRVGAQVTHVTGCQRETAIAIAKKHDAEWCRPVVKRRGQRVICC